MQEHDSLERELKELVAFEERGVDLSGVGKWEKMDKKQLKARVRMIKNRLAAKRSREHARTYVQELEGTLEALQSKNDALARRLAAVEAENEKLKRAKIASGGENNNTNGRTDRAGEPAALPYTSLQLDAVPLLFISLLSTLLLLPTPAPELHVPRGLRRESEASQACPLPRAGPRPVPEQHRSSLSKRTVFRIPPTLVAAAA